MKQLPVTFDKNDWHHQLICRDEHRALYRRSKEGSDKVHYEVFKVRIQKATTMKVGGAEVEYPEAEHYPNTNEFGVIAWSYPSLESAEAKYDQLEGWHLPPAPKAKPMLQLQKRSVNRL